LRFAKIAFAIKAFPGRGMDGKNRRHANVLSVCISILRLLLSGHQAIAIENEALRMQMQRFNEKRNRRS
jgi:hypothetical protein